MNNKKRITIALLVAVLLISIVGVTFAAYTYTRQGTSNSKQLVGDIYMHYTESNTLTLSNAMPRSTYIENNYFEFTIDGKNTTTNKDIYYDILLTHGDVPQDKTESNRIDDKFLKFRLVKIINNEETEIFNNQSYNDLTNKRIHVDTIPKNTTTEVVHTYRLYMWIGYSVTIGVGDNVDYTTLEWNNLFASIKVSSTGDFNEKEVTTDASCFLTLQHYIVNPNITNEATQYCVNYINNDLGWSFDTGETAEAFCNGTGTADGYTFQNAIDDLSFEIEALSYFKEHNIISESGIQVIDYDSNCEKDVVIPSKLPIKTYTLNSNLTNEEIQTCIQYTIDNNWGWNTGETAEAFCNGTGKAGGYTFQNRLDYYWFSIDELSYFKEHNIIIESVSSTNFNVTTIGESAFSYNQLISVVIPKSVTTIVGGAFYNNQIKSVVIPNSVTTIGSYAFKYNQLECVSLSSNTEYVSESNNASFDDTVTIHQGDDYVCPIIVKDSCFTGSVENNQVTIIDYDINCGLDVVIPNQINGYSVTTIVADAFNTKEILDDSYKYIGKGIKSVVLPNSLTTIGQDAFWGNQLTSVNIPSSVTTIEDGAFRNNQLTSVTIPSSVTTIGRWSFMNNQLASVVIPNSVTTIEYFSFYNNKLTSVIIPNSVITIEDYSFSGNQLINVEISNSVTTIGTFAFYGNQLTSVNIPSNVTTIGHAAFQNNQLTSVSISNSVTTIGVEAFYNNKLTNVTIPDSVTEIQNEAFSYNQLTSVIIGNGITSMGKSVFSKTYRTHLENNIRYYDNPNLTSITIDKPCNDIKNNLKYVNTNYYPWLSDNNSYRGIGGVTIYGSNNEVCDTF